MSLEKTLTDTEQNEIDDKIIYIGDTPICICCGKRHNGTNLECFECLNKLQFQ